MPTDPIIDRQCGQNTIGNFLIVKRASGDQDQTDLFIFISSSGTYAVSLSVTDQAGS